MKIYNDNRALTTNNTFGSKPITLPEYEVEYIGLELSNKNHVTLCYRPDDSYIADIAQTVEECGDTFEVTLVAYGEYWEEDVLKNIGYLVALPKELKSLFIGKVPHTTLGVFNGGKAVDTAKMTIVSTCNITVKGKLRCFTKGEH